MKKYLVILLFCIGWHSQAQDYKPFTQTIRKFYTGSPSEVDALWSKLVSESKIPFVVEDSVAFLYRGEAKAVQWMGDFNGSGYDKNFKNKGTLIPKTNIWILKCTFPADARLDYKILINETNWIVDPVNPNQQWMGLGGGSPNSELRMPRWQEDPITKPMEAIFHGRVLPDILIDSKQIRLCIVFICPQVTKHNPRISIRSSM
jgi:hypothetical protein